MRTLMRNGRVIILPLSLAISTTSLSAQNPQDQPIKDIVARLDRLQNLSVEYVSTLENITVPPIPDELKQARDGVHVSRMGTQIGVVEVNNCLFRRRADSLWFEDAADKQTILNARAMGEPVFSRRILCVTPRRVDSIAWQTTTGKMAVGAIQPAVDRIFISQTIIDVGLGLRQPDSGDWLIADALKAGLLQTRQDGFVEISVSADKHTCRWIFDPKMGYALRELRREFGDSSRAVFICEDFRKVNGIFLPFKIKKSIEFKLKGGGDFTPMQTTTLLISKITLDDPKNQDDTAFKVSWPKGTPFLDYRSGKRGNVGDKDQVLTDIDLLSLEEARVAPRAPDTLP